MLYKKSGLLGISGISNDMRDLLGSAEPAARLAVDYFVYRAAKEIGALAAVLGGVDGLVFTAGIGENSAEIRGRICEASAWLGIELDRAANERHGPRISTPGQRVSRLGRPDQRRADDRPAHRAVARTGRSPRLAREKRRETDMAATAAPSTQTGASEAAWQGFRPGLWQKRDQRPRLHPAELHAVRRRRRVPRAGDAAHAEASGRS